ncbi:MAG: transposase [Chitinophagales bacterium]
MLEETPIFVAPILWIGRWGKIISTLITGLAGNSVLHKKSEITRDSAKSWYDQHQKTIQRFHSFSYQAGSWKNPQRVIVKAEHTSKSMNVRVHFKNHKMFIINFL